MNKPGLKCIMQGKKNEQALEMQEDVLEPKERYKDTCFERLNIIQKSKTCFCHRSLIDLY